jgi:hypothetical protein
MSGRPSVFTSQILTGGRTTGSRANCILRVRFWSDSARRKLKARVRRPLAITGSSSSSSEELPALDPALEPVLEL